jgi:hypothetical protein
LAGRRKFFELLDFPKFGAPSVLNINPPAAAVALIERLVGSGGFMSYGQIWPRVDDVVRGLATDSYILNEFKAYRADWKNESIRNGVRLLRDYFGNKGTWYPEKSKPKFVLGFWFKPSIRGIWFYDGKAYAVLINARKTQPLTQEDICFLARGIYELHCIEDPNDPIPLIIDLSEREKGTGRELNAYVMPPEKAASLEEFELAVRRFLDALNLAGISLPLPPSLGSIVNLFKK